MGAQPVGGRRDRVAGERREGGRAHAFQPAADRHEQRQAADAVAERLDRVGAGLAAARASIAAGQSRIAMSSTVNCVLARRQVGARAVVEQPHVVAVLAEVLGEALGHRVEREGARGVAVAGGEHERALLADRVVREAELGAVGGREGMDSGLRQRDWSMAGSIQTGFLSARYSGSKFDTSRTVQYSFSHAEGHGPAVGLRAPAPQARPGRLGPAAAGLGAVRLAPDREPHRRRLRGARHGLGGGRGARSIASEGVSSESLGRRARDGRRSRPRRSTASRAAAARSTGRAARRRRRDRDPVVWCRWCSRRPRRGARRGQGAARRSCRSAR